jgi:hypothetical protein
MAAFTIYNVLRYVTIKTTIMKKMLLFILLLVGTFALAQTKQQLMDSIVARNELNDECRWMNCKEWEPYDSWQKLLKKINEGELVSLSKNNNAVLRMFATRELILSGKGDASGFLSDELKRNERVREVVACLIGDDYTYHVVYFDYWNKIRIEARDAAKSDDEELVNNAIAERVWQDSEMAQLDSLVIEQDNVEWLIYNKAFTNRKFDARYLPRIEQLAFRQHNMYALDHLQRHYNEKYKEQIASYWQNDFLKAEFGGENGIYYYNAAIEILLDTKDLNYKNIAIAKLKNDRSWEEHEAWFENTLGDYGLTLEDVAK